MSFRIKISIKFLKFELRKFIKFEIKTTRDIHMGFYRERINTIKRK